MAQLHRPDDQTIRQSLNGVVSSALFSRSERLRAFLTYVVEKELEGKGHHLKGYTIGIDVFDRSPAFNADSDPLVRVHAGKLRKLLAAYYAGEGVAEAWRIEIPKGTYVPEYRRRPVPLPSRTESHRAGISAGSTVSNPSASRRIAWLPAPLSSPLAVLSVLPLLVFVPLSSPASSVNIAAQSHLHGAVIERMFANDLPRVTVRSQGPRSGMAGRFAEALRTAATHYDTIAAVPRSVLWQAQVAPSVSDPLAFTISVSQQTSAPGVRVVISNDSSLETLQDIVLDEGKLADEADILYESLALARKSLAADGHIFRYASRQNIGSPLMRCMELTDSYRHLQTREAFQEARACQEKLSDNHRQKLKFVISASALPSNLIR